MLRLFSVLVPLETLSSCCLAALATGLISLHGEFKYELNLKCTNLILLSASCHVRGHGNPSLVYGWLAVAGLALYIIFFAPGMGLVPWAVNTEIYLEEFRGICGGMSATIVIMSINFLSFVDAIGLGEFYDSFGCCLCCNSFCDFLHAKDKRVDF
ncbi:hypothetical protein Ahy_B06g085027 [Arachis hypogaea]|uniref:Amino acid transporter transmembrane domain-containing protein n=1 Tax=Arachis hypogaea TaxID=3818 RepID=A0A444YTA9_ARAHY|nr:hypothetical protein Ahy_B06g085027 [Arachis hypogaea]